MNTSGHCKVSEVWIHVNFARDPKYSWFHEHSKNWIYFLNDCPIDYEYVLKYTYQ